MCSEEWKDRCEKEFYRCAWADGCVAGSLSTRTCQNPRYFWGVLFDSKFVRTPNTYFHASLWMHCFTVAWSSWLLRFLILSTTCNCLFPPDPTCSSTFTCTLPSICYAKLWPSTSIMAGLLNGDVLATIDKACQDQHFSILYSLLLCLFLSRSGKWE